jgi:hypothetical protein
MGLEASGQGLEAVPNGVWSFGIMPLLFELLSLTFGPKAWTLSCEH